ncbi:ABC transporter permease [Aestuariimicrobium soli]|uniref:ABC transporter permease n=1 Tax=Aestuariimicrobium soli TaxID=2035834 RepID=UPI003EBBDD68
MPIGFIVAATIDAGPALIRRLVFRPRVAELLGNTIALLLVVVPATVVIGTGAALLVERTRVPRWLSAAFVAPLAVPAFVMSYAWATVWPSIAGLAGASLIATISYFPFVYLPVLATLRRLDPALEESGRALGLTARGTLLRVVLPQLRLPVLGGALLVALHLLAEYGAFAFVRYDTFTTAIYDQFRSTFAAPAASMLAGVLVLLCLVVLSGETAVRGRQRHARLGSGVARRQRRVGLGWWIVPVAVGTVALLGAALGVPVWSLAHWLSVGVELDSALVPAIGSTLALAGVGAVATCLAAGPLAWLSVRRPTRWSRALEGVAFICASLPGIVVALAFVTVAIRWARPVYQTSLLLIAAYVVLFLPRAVASLRAGMAQVPTGLGEASRSLGRGPVTTLARVSIPLLAPAFGAAASMAFLGIAGELTATLLLAPTGTSTLASRFWSLSSELDYPASAPYALALIVLSVPMTIILFRETRGDRP